MVMTLIIVIATLCIYGWLWRRWTGDLLKGREPHDIVSSSNSSGTTAAEHDTRDQLLRPRSTRIASQRQAEEEKENTEYPLVPTGNRSQSKKKGNAAALHFPFFGSRPPPL